MSEPEHRRIGVYICHCGGNISDYVDVAAVRDALKDEADVVVSDDPIFACSDGTQHDMIADIQSKGLDGLVVASCSPKLHQTTFRNVAKRSGMNMFAYTQANIREQDSWAHTHDRAGATAKAIGLIRAAVAKTRLSDPLEPLVVKTQARTLVVGGGVTGLRAAIGLADIGIEVLLIEREAELGGWVNRFGPLFPNDASGAATIERLVQQCRARHDITVYTSAELTGKSGSFGNYDVEVTLHRDGGDKQVRVVVGSIIVATGFDAYQPTEDEFGYGTPGVMTLPDFKQLVDSHWSGPPKPAGSVSTNATGRPLMVDGRRVRSIAYIYCVGSRQPDGNEYCSKYCCNATIHTSTLVTSLDPGIRQFHLYRDIRAYGRNELMYNDSRGAGSTYIKYPDDNPPTVARDGSGLNVTAVDQLTAQMQLTVPVDLVVLVTGMVPRDNTALTELLKLPLGGDGFYNEIHPKLRPVETVVDGVMIAGCCQSPRTVGESVAAGLSAVAQSAALLKKGVAELDPLVARVDPDKCLGAGDCLTSCPYNAITSIAWESKTIATVDPAVCKGCGGCVPYCPNDAIDLLGYTSAQMLAAIDELLAPLEEVTA